mmetsp:Transcript_82256/g.241498  ORF Transcript_82256/g.241498 Transcript_82256/m.241498 type:complete len:210 (+) Transcript_82256:376-1005(+)
MKRPPKDLHLSLTSCAFFVWTSKCSGASRFEAAMAASMFGASTAKPLRTAGMATSRVGSTASCLRRAAFTLAMTSSSAVTRMGRASTSCSACARRSAARTSGSALPSAITSTSLGPASMSMPQIPLTMDFAAVTHLLPGPTMMSQAVTPTPWAIAAIACAPPTVNKQSAPATNAAAFVTSEGQGDATTTSATPAATAVQAVMITELGSG